MVTVRQVFCVRMSTIFTRTSAVAQGFVVKNVKVHGIITISAKTTMTTKYPGTTPRDLRELRAHRDGAVTPDVTTNSLIPASPGLLPALLSAFLNAGVAFAKLRRQP